MDMWSSTLHMMMTLWQKSEESINICEIMLIVLPEHSSLEINTSSLYKSHLLREVRRPTSPSHQ